MFLSPGVCGHCCSKRLSITKELKRKRVDRKKMARKTEGKASRVYRCSIFSFERSELGSFQHKQGLDTQTPRCKTKTFTLFVSCGYSLAVPYFCLLCCKLVSSETNIMKEISDRKPPPRLSD